MLGFIPQPNLLLIGDHSENRGSSRSRARGDCRIAPLALPDNVGFHTSTQPTVDWRSRSLLIK